MYKSFDKLVCTGTTTITYIQRHNTRYVKIYKDEFNLHGNQSSFGSTDVTLTAQ